MVIRAKVQWGFAEEASVEKGQIEKSFSIRQLGKAGAVKAANDWLGEKFPGREFRTVQSVPDAVKFVASWGAGPFGAWGNNWITADIEEAEN
ncbi:MAG: hypothetical protein WCK48_02410 [bacterium]